MREKYLSLQQEVKVKEGKCCAPYVHMCARLGLVTLMSRDLDVLLLHVCRHAGATAAAVNRTLGSGSGQAVGVSSTCWPVAGVNAFGHSKCVGAANVDFSLMQNPFPCRPQVSPSLVAG